MSFKKQIMNFIATNRTVMSVQESQGAKDDVVAAYVAGAKSVAQDALRLKEIAVELNEIFARAKEVVDHE